MSLPTIVPVHPVTLPPTLHDVGNTPLIRLQRVTADLPSEVELWAKAEWANPSGSVKDRPAAAILQRALDEGSLGPGRVLLDSTSGNMGIAYATFAARLGLTVHLAVPSNASPERLAMLRALGASLTLTDPSEGSDGARKVAAAMAASEPGRFFYADQYSHPSNWKAHRATTGPEIVRQTGGRVSHFVAGLGTTGTLVGTGRFLRATIPGARVIAVQPATPMHGLEGLKHLATSEVPSIFDPSIPDETIFVETEEAYGMARRLAREEGLLVGVSAAAAAAAALRIGRGIERGVIVVVFPDSGMKYLGQTFWSAA
jgi:cysteine synthase B